jgi:pyruvate, water dikinase
MEFSKIPNFLWLRNTTYQEISEVGGKASSLGEMYNNLQNLGIKVPNGFTLTTHLFRQFMKNIQSQIDEIIYEIDIDDPNSLYTHASEIRNIISNQNFSDNLKYDIIHEYFNLSAEYNQENTDVAVRSSSVAEDLADCSFAGMYDTFLNITNPTDLLNAIKKCYASLYNDRAILYRLKANRKFDDISLAVVIQKMVRSESSGVAFTADVESSFSDVVIINSAYGLCELVVQGEQIVPDEFVVYKPTLKKGYNAIVSKKLGDKKVEMVYSKSGVDVQPTTSKQQQSFSLTDKDVIQLTKWCVDIEQHYQKKYNHRHIDIEFAKDVCTQNIYIVQARPLTTFKKVETVYSKYELTSPSNPVLHGIAVGDKIYSGTVKIIYNIDDANDFSEGDILCTKYTSPDWEPLMKKAGAILTDFGGRTSHASIICREWGKCCIVGLKNATETLDNNEQITASCAEGETAHVYAGKLDYIIHKIQLDNIVDHNYMLNLASPDYAFKYHHLPNKGIGLLRVEFIINNYIRVHPLAVLDSQNDSQLETEIQQLSTGYSSPVDFFINKFANGIAKIACSVYPDDCITRTSDFKTNEYSKLLGGKYYEPCEENPMIGFRGASRYYSEEYEPAFRMECKAIYKARIEYGLDNIHVMIPFCRTVEEFQKVSKIMNECGLVSGENGLKIGIMCELPSNVVMAEEFCEVADFFSIGSNDLTQLTLGLDRDSEKISHLFDERHPAVLRQISKVIEICNSKGVKIGICGDAPSTYPEFSDFLLKCGISTISLTPDAILKVLKK